MMIYIKAYIGALIPLLVLDAIWLSLMAKKLYRPELGELMRDDPNLMAAALFYIFYVAGIVYFAVLPAMVSSGWWLAVVNGALLGALAYGTYAITNYAVLSSWSLSLAMADIIWGTLLTATAALGGYLTTRLNF